MKKKHTHSPSFSKVASWLLGATVSYKHDCTTDVLFEISRTFKELLDSKCRQFYWEMIRFMGV